jgi:hypothetical protein
MVGLIRHPNSRVGSRGKGVSKRGTQRNGMHGPRQELQGPWRHK